ncbi:MAG TPA: Gfo/Idh/MocA family oxidoreductase [Vicinamibacterales bacterium]|nr:Gfo/Idh/MocA family oxidoreductase [Vicinamibacterales bacterium]
MNDYKTPEDSEDTTATATAAVTRREFVNTVAGAGAAFLIVPRRVLGRGFQAPSDTANLAVAGINGMGAENAQAVMSQNIVAICDCDLGLLDRKLAQWSKAQRPTPRPQGPPPGTETFKVWPRSKAQLAADERWPVDDPYDRLQKFVKEQIPRLKKYQDYREMLDRQKDLDGVIVATPDHMHAIIASASMDAGKHVYVQKPLCWSVHEARHLSRKAAAMSKIVTQMGNQRHSQDEQRRGVEYILDGAIGEVREVHVWTNRPWGYWPQGIPRPATGQVNTAQLGWDNRAVAERLAAAMKGDYSIPTGLDWDLFLGVAPKVDYHPIYHPFNWRGWVDWGQGALGDMGAHLIDFPMWALNLGLPTVIETESTPFNGATYPDATTTHYEFPKRGNLPAVTLTWYDGGLMPSDPPELEGAKLNPGGGILYVGKKGKLLQESANPPRLLPVARHNAYGPPKERLTRVAHEAHEMNWVNTIKGKDQISCPFDYAATLTETMLLGIASLRANSKLYYDPANMKVTNNADANQFLTREYREGWKL